MLLTQKRAISTPLSYNVSESRRSVEVEKSKKKKKQNESAFRICIPSTHQSSTNFNFNPKSIQF